MSQRLRIRQLPVEAKREDAAGVEVEVEARLAVAPEPEEAEDRVVDAVLALLVPRHG
jgi:hypothetical protein